MQRAEDSADQSSKVVAGFLATAMALLIIGVLFVLLVTRDDCDEVEKALAGGPNGQTLTWTFRACTAFGTTVEGRVYLTDRDGHRVELLRYVPYDGSDGPPMEPLDVNASWVSPKEVAISLGTVMRVVARRSDASGTKVVVHIADDRSRENAK
jgi:hypothetical protein